MDLWQVVDAGVAQFLQNLTGRSIEIGLMMIIMRIDGLIMRNRLLHQREEF